MPEKKSYSHLALSCALFSSRLHLIQSVKGWEVKMFFDVVMNMSHFSDARTRLWQKHFVSTASCHCWEKEKMWSGVTVTTDSCWKMLRRLCWQYVTRRKKQNMRQSQLLSQASWHTFAQESILKAKDRIRIGSLCSTPTHHYRLSSFTGCEI